MVTSLFIMVNKSAKKETLVWRRFGRYGVECPLCQGHILTDCTMSLTEGCYTWQHNQILRRLASILEHMRTTSNAFTKKKKKKIYSFYSIYKWWLRGQNVTRSETGKCWFDLFWLFLFHFLMIQKGYNASTVYVYRLFNSGDFEHYVFLK